jgi:glycosyltransferase involved in cell wall biosynthesis
MQFAEALSRKGHEAKVIVLRRKSEPVYERRNGVEIYRIQGRENNELNKWTHLARILKFLVRGGFLLAKQYVNEPYDIVHVQSVPDFLVLAALFPKIFGVPIVLDVYDIVPEFYASKFGGRKSVAFQILLKVEKWCTAFVTHVIAPTELWRERLTSRSVPSHKCSVVRYLPDPTLFPEFSARTERSDGKFIILYPGSLNWHKGVDVAIRAFGWASAELPNAELHIYGEGPEKSSLIALTHELNLGEKIRFYDSVAKPDIAKIMKQASLAVEPKRASCDFSNEAASTKCLEFMRLGVPIIVSDTKINRHHFDDSTVYFFSSENESELCAAIVRLSRDAELRNSLISNAIQYSRKNDWSRKKYEYISLVESIVGQRVSGPQVNRLGRIALRSHQ